MSKLPWKSNGSGIRWFWALFLSIIWFVSAIPAGAASNEDHRLWDELLSRHVQNGLVDYEGFLQEREVLSRYLEHLAKLDVGKLSTRGDQLAFWINLYNACVVDGVLEYYPIYSVKEVPGFFKSERCRVQGETLTIDEVASYAHVIGFHQIHFAIVCASIGCPVLRNEAYEGKRIASQLSEQAHDYFHDPSRGLRLDESKSIAWVTKIIDWNREDFAQRRGWMGMLNPPINMQNLARILKAYVDPELTMRLMSRRWTVKVMSYDWRLNGIAQEGRTP